MQIDLFDNRNSSKVVKGDILEIQILPSDGSAQQFEHVCVTLNTGFNLLIELSALAQINRYVEGEK